MAATDRLRALYPGIPTHEWDRGACGVGLIANMDGRPTTGLVTEALDALSCLAHRGAASRVNSTDVGTSDGAGMMIDIYQPFYAAAFELSAAHPALAAHEDHAFAVGMLFLPPGGSVPAQGMVDHALRAVGLPPLGWRRVPIETSVLGIRARETMPCIMQVVVGRPEKS